MKYGRNLVLSVLGPWWLLLQSAPASPGAEVVRLAEGVYARIAEPDGEAVGNAGFVVLESGVLVFDTHATPGAGEALRAEVRKVTNLPIRFVVNSHFHPDHTHGNQAFSAGGTADVLASTQTRRDILQKDIPAMNRSLAVVREQLARLQKDLLAARTSADYATLRDQIAQRQKFLDRMVGLLGRGHTDGDVVLVLPDTKIAFAGDLFFNSALPAAQDAFLLDWSETLGALLDLDVETFVPGHGPVGTRADVQRFRRYLDDLRSLVEPSVAKGLAMEQVVREARVPDDYAGFRFQSFFPANVQKMYLELKALQA
ncbi:MAG: hypothetical protein DMG07_13245, partial [Acidobacteria bacterium]